MSEFSTNLMVYKTILQSIRMDVQRAPIELQLTWLFELAMVKAFLLLVSTRRFKMNPSTGNYVMREQDVRYAYDKKYTEILGRLQAYRDTFVHKGFSSAIYTYDMLCILRPLLNEFCAQDTISVTLNWDNRLF